MNFVTLTNRYGNKVVVRWDTIMSMTEKDVPVIGKGNRDTTERWTHIVYGEFGMAKSHDVVVQENTAEILRQISSPGEDKIDPEDTYDGLYSICELVASHKLDPDQAVALVQRFVEEVLVKKEQEREGE